jgi:hypothetical protein
MACQIELPDSIIDTVWATDIYQPAVVAVGQADEEVGDQRSVELTGSDSFSAEPTTSLRHGADRISAVHQRRSYAIYFRTPDDTP